MAGSAVRRPAGAKVLWALGLLAFAAGAAAEAYGEADGYGVAAFKVYYLAGGCLAVPLLGAGSLWFSGSDRMRATLVGALLVAVPAATISVLLADVRTPLVAAVEHGPPANDHLLGHAFLWAIALNVAGSIALIATSLRSLIARRRPTANATILVGLLAAILAGTATRLGSYEYVYLGQAVAIALLATGFELSLQRQPRIALRRLAVR